MAEKEFFKIYIQFLNLIHQLKHCASLTIHDDKIRMSLLTRQAMYVYGNTDARACNHYCSGKAISITYSECVFVDLGIQHAMRMRHIVTCCLSGCYNTFPGYLINGTIFGKKDFHLKMFSFSLQRLSETFLILRRTERDMIIKCISVFM
jgi:hypothetical protein